MGVMGIRQLAYSIFPGSLIGIVAAIFSAPKKSYAYIGEDLVAERLLKDLIGIRTGTYVDVGAFHPTHVSNTQRLYRAGWRGVNIEADPHKLAAFRAFRRQDINVCAVIDAEERDVAFFTHEGAKFASMAGLDRAGVEKTAKVLGRHVTQRT